MNYKMEHSTHLKLFARCLLRIRPAPLACGLSRLFQLHHRRYLRTPEGLFYINPISTFGYALLNGAYEPDMSAVLEQHLHNGAVFVDLGANEGFFSVVASRLVGPRGSVIAVEPQSRLQSVLLKNFEINNCYNVRLIRCAIANQTGVTRLMIAPETNTGSSGLFRSTRYRLPSEAVQAFTLEEFFEKVGLDRCDLIKIDVEGAEYDIVTSSTAFLKRGIIRNVAIEFHDAVLAKRGLHSDAIREAFALCGFVLTRNYPAVYSFKT